MSRAKSGIVSKKRHKKILKLAKGYRGRAKNCFRVAIEKVEKGLSYAYRDRRNRKRNFRSLWIQRINAIVRRYGMKYSEFIGKIKNINININRKMLAAISINNPNEIISIINLINENR